MFLNSLFFFFRFFYSHRLIKENIAEFEAICNEESKDDVNEDPFNEKKSEGEDRKKKRNENIEKLNKIWKERDLFNNVIREDVQKVKNIFINERGSEEKDDTLFAKKVKKKVREYRKKLLDKHAKENEAWKKFYKRVKRKKRMRIK